MRKSYFYLGSVIAAIALVAAAGSQIPTVRTISTSYLVGATDYLAVYVDNPSHPAPDVTPPVVTLIGSATVNLTIGDVYTELGATSTDNRDSNLPINIYVDGTASSTSVNNTFIDTSFAGTHSILYTATDAANNVGSVTRTINVIGIQNHGGGNNGGGSSGGGGGGGGVVAPSTTPPTSTPGATTTPNTTPGKITCAKGKGDLNCDGKVNIIDFSLLAYWYKRPLTAQAKLQGVDLNGDGKVTLADFSILAYYWNK